MRSAEPRGRLRASRYSNTDIERAPALLMRSFHVQCGVPGGSLLDTIAGVQQAA